MAPRNIAWLIVFVGSVPGMAQALETDQFLVWGVELEDSAPAINAFLNAELQRALDAINSDTGNIHYCEEIPLEYFRHVFLGLRGSRLVRTWLKESDEVQLYPERDMSAGTYREISIYRERAFPYFLPLARTLRAGDVYFGVDKFGHFFGYGRRYYKKWQRLLRQGIPEEEAVDRVIDWGIFQERSFVGLLTDGVFSHADLEANYQGFRLAQDFCGWDDPIVRKEGREWVINRAIDFREYVTPDFDESYNMSHYWGRRRTHTLSAINEKYEEMRLTPMVRARFQRYGRYAPSRSKEYIDAYFRERGEHPQTVQWERAFHPEEGTDEVGTEWQLAVLLRRIFE